MLGELTDAQINNVLASQVLGRLACTDGKQPYIVPVTYTYDGDHLYGQTNEGTKLAILRKNPNVCFETDMMTDMANWQCVLVFGRFEELKGEEAEKAREILFNRVLGLMTSSTIHAHEHGVTAELDDTNRVKTVMYRIKIKEKSGRFEKR
ncbi:MAG TPA: pyridoxamine 5'-phosphate oxidase family protein [Chitinophagaceae bacterium]|nr:pyridoxamine 5'-phosphate oxidase family protein [Chitinophagaceae bacterium]